MHSGATKMHKKTEVQNRNAKLNTELTCFGPKKQAGQGVLSTKNVRKDYMIKQNRLLQVVIGFTLKLQMLILPLY
jgi:hypothetical protein